MLLSSSNRKYQPIIIFFRGCVPEMSVTLYTVTYCIYIHSGKTGLLFSLLLRSLWWVHMVGYVLACRSYSYVCILHHLIIIIVQPHRRHWTYKMPVRYILSSVWVRAYSLSCPLYKYGAVCFQFTHFPCDDWENVHFVLLSSSNR